MSRYTTGVRNEKRSMEYYKAQDYFCMDSRGSHGMFDVIATYIGTDKTKVLTIYIQCKTHGGFKKSLIDDLRHFANVVKHHPYRVELHDWKKYQRVPNITIIK